MSKAERIIMWVAVALSLAMSIFALCRSLPREAGVDYMGVIVGILALLVTVLIGWNIYTVVDFSRRLSKVRKKAESKVSKTIAKHNHTVRGLTYFLHSIDFYNRNITEMAVDGFIAAIEEGLNGYDPLPTKAAFEYLYDMTDDDITIIVKRGAKPHYISILSRLDDERITDVIKMINEATETGE